MSERDGFQAGVPGWVAAVVPDPEAGVAFYTELSGWEAADIMPPDGPGRYYVCTLGAKVLVPPFDSPTGRTGILADPQGATFSLSTAPTAPTGP